VDLETCLRYLETLYILPRLTSTRIAQSLGINTSIVKQIFNLLRFYGIHVGIDVVPSRIGLRIAILLLDNVSINVGIEHIIKNVPFAKSVGLVAPNKLFITLHPPKTAHISEGIYRVKGINMQVFVFNSVIRSRPLVTLLEAVVRNDFDALLRNGIEQVFASRVSIDTRKLFEEVSFDGMDLDIVRTLQKKPWLTMHELARELNIRARKLEHHLVNHAENLILGYRIARMHYLTGPNVSAKLLIYVCNDVNVVEICRHLAAHPFITSCAFNSERRSFVIAVHAPQPMLMKFSLLLNEYLKSFGCDIETCMEYVLDRSLFLTSTVPRRGPEFVKALRGWSKGFGIEDVVDALLKLGIKGV